MKIISQILKKKNTKKVDLVAKLFDEIAPKYADRKNNYSKVIKIKKEKLEKLKEKI